MKLRTQRRGFTLVELLVVIGIIALLISILLPALNKARQQANSIDCQSRLRQMGQALAIYEAENKGFMPWGAIRRDETLDANTTYQPGNEDQVWWWYFTLSEIMNRNILGSDGYVHNLSPVFTDHDIVENGTPVAGVFYSQDYTVNERVFWSNNDTDSSPGAPSAPDAAYPGNLVPQRQVGGLKPATSFLIWDAPQCVDLGNNAYGLATALDGNELTYGHFFDTMYVPAVNYDRAAEPGQVSTSQLASLAKSNQKKYNADQADYLNPFVALRFRHLNNSSMNALCADGHCESRPVGGAMVNDFIVSNPY